MRLIWLCILMVIVFAAPTRAQESINVRVGEHGDYTRIVFDWPDKTGYTLEEETSNSINISFSKAASIGKAISGDNFTSFNIASENPLNVEIGFPDGGRTRVFPIGNRVVIDVYAGSNNTRPEPQSELEPQPQPQPEPALEPVPVKPEVKPATPEPVAETEEQVSPPDEAELDKVQEALNSVEGIIAEVANPNRPRGQSSGNQGQAPAQQLQEQAQEVDPVEAVPPQPASERNLEEMAQNASRPNIFTLSATQSIGMAVFDNFGQLWMVTDKPDLYVKPQVSGANAEYFKPIQENEITGGRSYISKTLPPLNIRAQGGGLVWNIYVTPNEIEKKPVVPKRLAVRQGSERSGKIVWPLESAKKVLNAIDPITGADLIIVTVENSDDFAGAARSFVDFDVLPSYVGLAIRPNVDDLNVQITSEGVEISRDNGLSILPEEKVTGIEKETFADRMASADQGQRRLFNFKEWRMGGLGVLNENENIILSGMNDLTASTQIENLITLAKMQLANGRGAEALGYLDFAQLEIPELTQNPEFLSARGVANAFAWKTDDAFRDLSSPILNDYDEIKIWRAFALADLGDWQQAYDVLPKNLAPIQDYPPEVRNRLGVVLAEIFLRGGDVEKAEQLFSIMEKDDLNMAHEAAMKYLQGEAARQKGNIDETIRLWTELTEGRDDLYRVKAGLALTRLLMTEDKLTAKQAIDRLERLRYAWRGDELEAQVNYWLGRIYFENGQYIKGLTIMREAASLVPDTIFGERIAGDMSNLFTDFYLDEGLAEVSPLDAVALYEQFQELVPAGPQGNALISGLAEHMVRADLLDRAADLLSYQINHRLSGDEAARTATRLAAINLIDKNPRDAVIALNKATDELRQLPEDIATKDRFEEISLLRARALSQNNQTDQALAILESLPSNSDVNRLRAEIAWTSGFWDDASYALEDVILDENISLTRPLRDEHAMLILQRAVAQNLSGDRIGLANLREKYSDAMAQTDKARLFDVVTRPRQSAGLADRDTLLSTVAEIDLFADFLNSYKQVDRQPSN